MYGKSDIRRSKAGTAPVRSRRRVCWSSRTGGAAIAFFANYLLLSFSDSYAQTIPPLVYVERQIPADGNAYWPARALPGVGAYARLRPAAPARLRVRDGDGSLRTLLDGGAANATLIDMAGPAVSWDGTRIAFAGLAPGNWSSAAGANPGGWRIYLINADGSGLQAVTHSDISADYSQFGTGTAPWPYDDYDPAWLPDGRLVFASTRWPAFAHHADARTSNLWIVGTNGAGLHRITSERNGADRPLLDPVSGKIVYFRWWRNHRLPEDSLAEVALVPDQPQLGWQQQSGLSTQGLPPARNSWQIVSINPDGAELVLFAGKPEADADGFGYGGGFAANGTLYANYFPSHHLADAAGFGGIRSYRRGATQWNTHSGVTRRDAAQRLPGTPEAAQLYTGPYTTDAEVLPDGRLVFARAADTSQDYGLWIAAPGGAAQPLVDTPGVAELRPRVLAARTPPPVLPDVYRDQPLSAPYPQFLPPPAGAAMRDGSFVFDARNVYANAAVDVDIPSAPAVGSAASIRFYADHQRRAVGTFPSLDWPLLLGEQAISAAGRVSANAPAFLPLFEQLRTAASAGYTVPRTGWPRGDGRAYVAGMNHDRAGVAAQCSGCHAGHTLIPVPSETDAPWSNLAPGAQLSASSTRPGGRREGLVDRQVFLGPIRNYWTSAPGQVSGQWVELEFPVPVAVRRVRLYNPRPGDEANSSLQVTATRVTLRDANGTVLDTRTTGSLLLFGSDVGFADIAARRVRVEILGVTGTFDGASAAGLAEIEVIAQGLAVNAAAEDRLFRTEFE
ncbi:MAG: PD40 domain-containing protein [Rhodanobacteraceae bacterium]|nr:PD40 domain-containing protein [Rhodanobacteraceae bacterium]